MSGLLETHYEEVLPNGKVALSEEEAQGDGYKRILVAEDDLTSRVKLTGILKKWGYEVEAFGDGNAAWERLHENDPPKILIVDWQMPGMDGVSLCRDLRSENNEDRFYIILLTGRTDKEDMIQALDEGVDDYICKPFDTNELRSRIGAGKRVIDYSIQLKQSRERYRALMEAVPNIVIYADLNGRITWANEAGHSFFGVQCLGKNWQQLWGVEKDSQEAEEILEHLRQNPDELIMLESLTTRCDDEERWVQWSCRSVNEWGSIGIGRDITEDKNRAHELSDTKLLLEAVLNSITDAIFVLRPDTSVVMVNKAAIKAAKLNPEDIYNRPLRKMLPYCSNCDACVIDQACEGLFHARQDIFVKENKKYYEEISHPIIGESNEVELIVYQLRDITGRRRKEKALVQAERMSAVGVLAGGVAHEFNNINAIILGCAELLSSDPTLSDDSREDVSEICTAAKRAVEITERLLQYSRTDTTKKEQTKLGDVAQSIYKMLESYLHGKHVTTRVEFCDQEKLFLNPSEIGQVVTNLIINAEHAMVQNEEKHIEMVTGEDRSEVFLKIKDNGCGIPQEKLEEIFLPFSSGKGEHAESDNVHSEVKGRGLGLSVSQTIVTDHGGTITVESTVGVGSTFTVRFPKTGGKIMQTQRLMRKV